MTEEELLLLIEEGENQQVEFKKTKETLPNSVWESYSAFANTDGGKIILGVEEKKGKFVISGVQNADKIVKDFWNQINNPQKVNINILFKMFGLVGVGERAGSGLHAIHFVWNQFNLYPPKLKEEFNPERVCFELSVEKSAKPALIEVNDPAFESEITSSGNNVTKEERLSQIVLVLKSDSRATVELISKRLRVSRRRILRDLEKLQKHNVIQRVGGRKEGYWEVVE